MKYATLHCSYSAPVRVSEALRATTAARAVSVFLELIKRDAFVVAVRVAVLVCCVATRTVLFFCAGLVLMCCPDTPVRMAVDVPDERDTAKPLVVHNAQKTKIIPILFISGIYFSKFQIFRASK